MPPKRKAAAAAASSSSKRQVKDDADSSGLSDPPSPDASSSAKGKKPAAKKGGKAAKEPVKPLDPNAPTNKSIPETLAFPKQEEGRVRIATWNVAGLASARKKGFDRYVEAEDADVLIVTETKINKNLEDTALSARYPHQSWSHASKNGYAGVAVLSKLKPLSVSFGLPTHPDPPSTDGRIVTLEFQSLYLIAVYVPNAGQGLKTMSEKEAWNAAFETYLRELDGKKPVVWGGDLNVIADARDLRNDKSNWNKTPGWTEKEKTAFERQLNPAEGSGHGKLVDAWRAKHPDAEGEYTYWSFRFDCRTKGIGWRLDSFIVSERILARVKLAEIRADVYGASDHVPVVMEIEGTL